GHSAKAPACRTSGALLPAAAISSRRTPSSTTPSPCSTRSPRNASRSRCRRGGPSASSSRAATRKPSRGRGSAATPPRTPRAAAHSPVGGLEALIERSIGYALHQARRPDEARPHFDESLRIAREQKAEYEVALTLRALAATGASDGDPRAESEAILERLHVVL